MRQKQIADPELYTTCLTHDFDIFKFADQIGRPQALPYLLIHMLDNLPVKEESLS